MPTIPIPTADMLAIVLAGEKCPICYAGFEELRPLPEACGPWACNHRPATAHEQRVIDQNRATRARIGPLLTIAARNAIVKAHLNLIAAGSHPDPTSALIGMVAHLVEQNAGLVNAEVERLRKAPAVWDMFDKAVALACVQTQAGVPVGPLTPEQQAEVDLLLENPPRHGPWVTLPPGVSLGPPTADSFEKRSPLAAARPLYDGLRRYRDAVTKTAATNAGRPPEPDQADTPTVVGDGPQT